VSEVDTVHPAQLTKVSHPTDKRAPRRFVQTSSAAWGSPMASSHGSQPTWAPLRSMFARWAWWGTCGRFSSRTLRTCANTSRSTVWATRVHWVCSPPPAAFGAAAVARPHADSPLLGWRRDNSHGMVSRPFPSWNRSILTDIYLCDACSCQKILRTETAGQGVCQ
jgi:hypothetical protein